MLIKFDCDVDGIGIIPFSIWINKVLFFTEIPFTYKAIFKDKDGEIIFEINDENPEQCFINIRRKLDEFMYKPQNVEVDSFFEPTEVFQNYIIQYLGN